jgi:hypothetical protein
MGMMSIGYLHIMKPGTGPPILKIQAVLRTQKTGLALETRQT